MRILLALIVGIVVGAAGMYFYQTQPGTTVASGSAMASGSARDAAAKSRAAANDFSAAFSEKMREWHLTPDDIHADLAKTGAVARQNAARAREKVADVRIVAVIKAKYVLDRDLSAGSIHVESQEGDVTLTGTVGSEALIARAVADALDTEGVHHVTAHLTAAP